MLEQLFFFKERIGFHYILHVFLYKHYKMKIKIIFKYKKGFLWL